MKMFQFCFSLLLCTVLSIASLPAQSSGTSFQEALDAGLTTYVKNIHPKKGCTCNECGYTYKGSKAFKVTKKSVVEGVLRVNAMVKIKWKNAFTAGEEVIPVYAEFKKEGDDVVMTKLKWRKDACMQFETLFQ